MANPEDVTARLILEGKPRTILELTEFAHFLDAREQLGDGWVLGETQIPDLGSNEGNLMRLGRRLERRLAHDVLGPVADVATGVDKPLEQLVLGQPADHDRLPDVHEILSSRADDDQCSRQDAMDTVHAADLVHQRLDLT